MRVNLLRYIPVGVPTPYVDIPIPLGRNVTNFSDVKI